MYELKNMEEVIEALQKHLRYRQGFALSQPRPSEVNEAIQKAIRYINDRKR